MGGATAICEAGKKPRFLKNSAKVVLFVISFPYHLKMNKC